MINFSPAALAPYFIVRSFKVAGSIGGQVQFLWPNVNRVSLMLGSFTGAVTVYPGSQIASIGGWTIPLNQPPVIIKYADVGPIVGNEWWIALGGGNGVFGFEVIFNPPTGE